MLTTDCIFVRFIDSANIIQQSWRNFFESIPLDTELYSNMIYIFVFSKVQNNST